MRKKRSEQGIRHINPLFERYKKVIKAPQGSVIEVFRSVVKEELGLSIKKKYISYNPANHTLSVSLSGPAKSEVLLYKERILKQCTEVLGEKSAPRQIL